MRPGPLLTTAVLRAVVCSYVLQIRAMDPSSGLPGDPVVWSWKVAGCSGQEYAVVDGSGVLTCVACPLGGNCTLKGTTIETIVSAVGWWGSPRDTRDVRVAKGKATFFECPLPNSCVGGNVSHQCNSAAGFSSSAPLCASCKHGFVRSQDEVDCSNAFVLIITLCGCLCVLAETSHWSPLSRNYSYFRAPFVSLDPWCGCTVCRLSRP